MSQAAHKCIFIKKSDASFILGDQSILQEPYQLIELHQRNCGGIRFFLIHLATLFRMLFLLPGKSFVYIWFADYHSLLPVFLARLFGKPSFVVIGGYDAAKRPDLNYGGHVKSFRSWCIKKTCDWATYLLPVTKFTQEDLALNINKLIPGQELIYNGVSSDRFPYLGEEQRQKKVLTICGAADEITIKRKGVDFFFSVAKEHPEISFRVIGLKDAALAWATAQHLDNMEIIAWVDHEDLPGLLNESTVICQFSRYEAFGVALVEGILCGNIPVGYAFGGTKEIIESLPTGELIRELSVEEAGVAITRALSVADQIAPKEAAIAMVKKRFSMDTRKAHLLRFISKQMVD